MDGHQPRVGVLRHPPTAGSGVKPVRSFVPDANRELIRNVIAACRDGLITPDTATDLVLSLSGRART